MSLKLIGLGDKEPPLDKLVMTTQEVATLALQLLKSLLSHSVRDHQVNLKLKKFREEEPSSDKLVMMTQEVVILVLTSIWTE